MIDSTLKNAMILIVDDNESNIDILQDLLEETGYTNYQSTTDPRLVVGMFKTLHPDLILLDLMMPHLSGFEVMDLLKSEMPPKSYIPILVLTADITSETKLRALSGGAKDFLSKPFDLYEIQLRINNLLETRYLHQQLENQNMILEDKVKVRTLDLELANVTLDRANKELEVLDQAKSEFLSMINHEIRTPLNGILGFTSFLKKEIKSSELLKYIQYLEESTQRLEAFSYQALRITELRTGKRKIKSEPVSVDELVMITKKHLQEKLQAKGFSLIVHKDQSIEEIRGDRELVQICFDQLIENSLKFSANNDVVILKVFSENQSIICEFIDNGSGFPTKILNNPFRFFELGDRHVDQNTGLNLALIKLIMDAHQGKIEVQNNQTKGATIKLTFINQS
jgi:two-component system sensor histidine kinase/response regulator